MVDTWYGTSTIAGCAASCAHSYPSGYASSMVRKRQTSLPGKAASAAAAAALRPWRMGCSQTDAIGVPSSCSKGAPQSFMFRFVRYGPTSTAALSPMRGRSASYCACGSHQEGTYLARTPVWYSMYVAS